MPAHHLANTTVCVTCHSIRLEEEHLKRDSLATLVQHWPNVNGQITAVNSDQQPANLFIEVSIFLEGYFLKTAIK